MTRIPPSLALVLGLAACASIPDEERALMTKEIDCAEAESDIAALERARPGTLRALRAVGSTITAGGLIYGVATDDIDDRGDIASGRYGERIDARIALIRETCGLPGAATGQTPAS